jgi:uncharacterized protein (DUF934 family)
MNLWRTGGFVDDPYKTVADADAVPEKGAIIVSAARWTKDNAALESRADPVGVSIAPGKDAEAQLVDAARRPLVALAFPKFGDGRAYSLARLLRERNGFTGELRATGDVLLDELSLMLRCGFDSFEIVSEPTLKALRRGHLPGVSLYYQPADGPEVADGARPWRRRQSAPTR